jgi:hypothetical protein
LRREVGVPAGVSLALLRVAEPDAIGRDLVHQPRTVVEVGGTDLDVSADCIHDQRQHSRVVHQVEERLAVRQQVPHLESSLVAGSGVALVLRGDVIDGAKQPLQLGRRQEVGAHEEALLVPALALGWRHRQRRLLLLRCHLA